MFGNLMKIVGMGDNRRDRRVTLRLPAAFGEVRGRLTDLSLGGCGFYPDTPGLAIGDRGCMHIRVTDETILTVDVAIVATDEEGMIYSVAFDDLDEQNFRHIEGAIAATVTAQRDRERTPRLPMPRKFDDPPSVASPSLPVPAPAQ